MTSKNAILLIVKQNNGIELDQLLGKITASYTNINSARAALSRAIKDMNAVNLIERKENKLFITEKGESKIHSDLKNKLILKLNQEIKSSSSLNEVDSIIKQLQTLIERSKQDPSLLSTAKNSSDFFIFDLEVMKDAIEARALRLNYFAKIFQEQIQALKEFDFKDVKSKLFNHEILHEISGVAKELGVNEFSVNCDELVVAEGQQKFIDFIAEKLLIKTKLPSLTIKIEQLPEFLSLIENEFQKRILSKIKLIIFMAEITITITSNQIEFFGPFKKLSSVLKK